MSRWAAVAAKEGRAEEVGAVHTAALACLAEALNTASGPSTGLEHHLQALSSSQVGACPMHPCGEALS